MLYLLIFSHVLKGRVQVYEGVDYSSFLIPGLAMMSLLQNAFANTSSSIAQSKITGNIVFVLLTPLSNIEFFAAYVLASCVRGLLVCLGVLCATSLFVDLPLQQPLWVFVFALLGAGLIRRSTTSGNVASGRPPGAPGPIVSADPSPRRGRRARAC